MDKRKVLEIGKKMGILVGVGSLMLTSGCATKLESAKKEPTVITVWTYYNGDQLESFNKLVDEFNNTIGKENGYQIESSSQGTVNDLEQNVMDAAEGKVGASDMPNIFAAYADTAYELDKKGLVVDIGQYLTDDEKKLYIDSFLEEGDFTGDGSIKIFPTAKSTEVLFLNDTDWAPFAEATGASYEDLETIEGVVKTAQSFYEWTDAQTSTPNDGKAFFGRDAMANYMLVGAKELGCTIFDVEDGSMKLNFDEEVARKLWDNYYVPYVKGYFASAGRFRSDDIKTGTIISCVGSTSSATFFPTKVLTSETESHDISVKVLPTPVFEDSEATVVQQGAGMVVTKTNEEQEKACVEFLKWFTQPKNNIAFSVGSGYLPVTYEANDMKKIEENAPSISDSMKNILTVAVDSINTRQLYTTKAFSSGGSARPVLEYALSDLATADRQTVELRIASGESIEDAVAEFLSDEYFEQWYTETLEKLQKFEG